MLLQQVVRGADSAHLGLLQAHLDKIVWQRGLPATDRLVLALCDPSGN